MDTHGGQSNSNIPQREIELQDNPNPMQDVSPDVQAEALQRQIDNLEHQLTQAHQQLNLATTANDNRGQSETSNVFPQYIRPSTTQIIRLNGSNYPSWRFIIRKILSDRKLASVVYEDDNPQLSTYHFLPWTTSYRQSRNMRDITRNMGSSQTYIRAGRWRKFSLKLHSAFHHENGTQWVHRRLYRKIRSTLR